MEKGKLTSTGADGIYRISVPPSLHPEVGRDSYPRVTFRRDVAIAEADAEEWERVEFLSPGHPLIQAALRRMRGKVFAPGFTSRVSYRKVPADQSAGMLFTYAARFVDGRGETIEERFEVVFVGLDAQVSRDPDADLRRFVHPASFRGNPNLTEQEVADVLPRFQAAFEQARERAWAEAQQRQEARVQQLVQQQERIAEDALMRLGLWKHASEDRLRQRFDAGQVQQYDLFGQVSRRLQQFRKEQELLLKQEETRREEIRAMKRVRADSIDAIGALVLIPVEE
jgi:hypothetical protein